MSKERNRNVIRTEDAITEARNLLGINYEALDCIGLIIMTIRTAAGGVPGYRVAHTNALWDSIDQADKYRDTVWRQRGLNGARAGMLCWKIEDKRDGTVDAKHVGLITDVGTVIHSSFVHKRVIEEPLTEKNGWNGLSQHRNIALGDLTDYSATGKEDGTIGYMAIVATKDDDRAGFLRLRERPSDQARVIGYLPRGTVVEVQASKGAWLRVRFEGMVGYCWAALTRRVDTELEAPQTEHPEIVAGRSYTVTIPHLNEATALEILERYPIAEAKEEPYSPD